ncbi:MAG: EamA family transporter [Paludibacteraceae bacterium]|nr:EamA family transporter [Paludibacteraceae bacterium]
MKRMVPYIAVITAMLIWAGSGIAVKEALVLLSPLQLVVVRFTIAVILMLCVGLLASGQLKLQKLERGDWWLFVLAGIFQPFLYFILETYSYKLFATPTIAEAFLSTNPLIAPIFALIFLRERSGWLTWLGIIVSTAGMLLLVLAGSDNFEVGNLWGVPLALVTVCMAASYSILLRKIPSKYTSLTIVFWGQLIGLILFYLVYGVRCMVYGGENMVQCMVAGEQLIRSLCGVGYLGIFSSVAAFVLFCYSVRSIGVVTANIFNNVRPVFTALLMLCIFGEQLPLGKWIGIFVIVLGLFICQKQRKK